MKRKQNTRNNMKAVALACLAIVFVYAYFQHSKAQVKEGTTVTETDSTLIENTVTKGTDKDGQVVFTNVRVVKDKKSNRAKGLEIPAYLTDRDEEIVQHEGFTLSYNRKRLVPNWVAWVLTRERVKGSVKRLDDFQPDESIRKGPIAQDTDYRGSGYDRGHMCPSADCKQSKESQRACFLLSNMCPQTHALNAGDWKELEEKCRKWTNRYDSIYIVCGPVIEKGKQYQTIGEDKVMVPTQFFKVLMRFTKDGGCQMVGFIYNNDETNHPMKDYACTVDEVEKRTGINFFSKLPKQLETKAEASYDLSKW